MIKSLIQKTIIIFALIISAVGCLKEQPTENIAGELSQIRTISSSIFEIRIGETVKTDEVTVSFVRVVEDSRCPEGAACIWSGSAKAEFIITNAENESETIVLSLTGLEAEGGTPGRLFSYSMTKLLPYPKIHQVTDPEAYIAYLKIDPLPLSGTADLVVQSFITNQDGIVKTSFGSNDKIVLHSVITNSTSKEISLTKPNGGPYIEFTLNKNGQPVAGSFDQTFFTEVMVYKNLKPGESISINWNLPSDIITNQDLYDFDFNANFASDVNPVYADAWFLYGY